MTTLDPWAIVADIVDPPDPRTFELLGYTPNPGPQTELHQIAPFSKGGPFDVLYGGAAFGGKSWGLLMDALDKCKRWPGLEVWWVREDYPQLRHSVIRDLERMGYAKPLGCTWHAGEKVLRFTNGSLISFLHARNMQDAAEMLSASCQLLVLDERTTLDPDVVEKLSTRVRSGRPGVPVIGVRSATNPGGKGHSWVKRTFVDPAPLGRQRIPAVDDQGHPVLTDDGQTMDRMFLPARIDDNPAGRKADPTYAARFSMMAPDLAAAYRDGDWTRFEGMRFSRFDPRRHVIPAGDVDLPLGGIQRGLGIDWGMAAPFAAVWATLLNEQLVIYRELHEPNLTPSEQAAKILAAEQDGERLPQRPIRSVIDPSTWARDPRKPLGRPLSPNAPPSGSIADGYRKAGVPVEKAFNDRIAGWTLLDELLGDLPDGRPRMIFLDCCPNVIRSLSGAPRSTKHPEDVDEKYTDDHAADGLRYVAFDMMGGKALTERPGRGSAATGVRGAVSGVGPS